MKNQARTTEFLYVVLPKIVGGVAALLLNVFLMRQFSPPEYGKFSLCLYYILLFDNIIGSAVDYGTVKLESRFTPEKIVGSGIVEHAAFRLKFVVASLVLLVSIIGGGPLGRTLFHDETSGWLIPFSSLAGFCLIMLRSIQVHYQIRHRFRAYGLIDLAHNFLRYSLIAAALNLFNPSPQAVILSFALAPGLLLLLSAASYRRNETYDGSSLWNAQKELVGTVKWYLATFCLGAVMARADVYLLSIGRNLEETGIFSAASVYAMVPELIAGYLAVIYQPKIIRNAEAGTLTAFFKTSMTRNLLISIATTVATALAALFLIDRFAPASYGSGKAILLILLPGAFASMMMMPLTMPLLMYMKPSFWIRMEGVALPFLLAVYWFSISRHGVFGAAMVTSVYKSGKCLVSHYVALKYIRQHEKTGMHTLPLPTAGG